MVLSDMILGGTLPRLNSNDRVLCVSLFPFMGCAHDQPKIVSIGLAIRVSVEGIYPGFQNVSEHRVWHK